MAIKMILWKITHLQYYANYMYLNFATKICLFFKCNFSYIDAKPDSAKTIRKSALQKDTAKKPVRRRWHRM